MSNSGADQPIVPRRSLRKTSMTVDNPTPPMGVPAYAGEKQQGRQPASPTPSPRQVPAPASGPVQPQNRDGAVRSAPPATAPPATAPSAPTNRRPVAQPQAPVAPSTAAKGRTVRRARLRMVRIDPWSVAKTAFLLSIAFGIMCVVAVFLIMSVLSAAGLWDHVNQSIQSVLNQDPSTAFNINDYVSTQRVLGLTMLIAALDVVLITALATLGAFLYNMAASLLGGIEVTLAEDPKR